MKILRKLAAVVFFLSVHVSLFAQRPFEGYFLNNDLDISCRINLYADSIPVPGLETDSSYGYIQGRINGTWILLKQKEASREHILMRAVSDRGSDAQDIEFVLGEDGQIIMRQVDGAYIKGIDKRKYVKLPKNVVLSRMGGKK